MYESGLWSHIRNGSVNIPVSDRNPATDPMRGEPTS